MSQLHDDLVKEPRETAGVTHFTVMQRAAATGFCINLAKDVTFVTHCRLAVDIERNDILIMNQIVFDDRDET